VRAEVASDSRSGQELCPSRCSHAGGTARSLDIAQMSTHPRNHYYCYHSATNKRGRAEDRRSVCLVPFGQLCCVFSVVCEGVGRGGMSNAHWSIATVNIYTTCGRASTYVCCLHEHKLKPNRTSPDGARPVHWRDANCPPPLTSDSHSKCKRVLPPHRWVDYRAVMRSDCGGRCRQTNRFSYDHDSTEWSTVQTPWPDALPHLDSWTVVAHLVDQEGNWNRLRSFTPVCNFGPVGGTFEAVVGLHRTVCWKIAKRSCPRIFTTVVATRSALGARCLLRVRYD
jgi:hypothetical protein